MNFVAPIRDRMGRTFGLPVILACAILLGSSAGWSQTSGSTDEALEQQYEEAFQELFGDPGDLEKTFKFAELAVKVGELRDGDQRARAYAAGEPEPAAGTFGTGCAVFSPGLLSRWPRVTWIGRWKAPVFLTLCASAWRSSWPRLRVV